jgi:hypothetical protein
LRRYGRPLSHYTDQNSIFRFTGRATIVERTARRSGPLAIRKGTSGTGEWIAAQTPQAKGRIERLFETLEDCLVKGMHLAGIDTIEAANHFLEQRFIPERGRRFTVTPRNPRNADRRLERDDCLDQILSVRVPHNLAFRGEIEEAQYLSEVSFYSFCQHPLSGLKASGPSPVRWAWRTSMHRRERSIVPDSDQQLSAHPSTS